MNCCDDYGKCTRGKTCPARAATTKTYPRTMRQAFGPYTSDVLHPKEDLAADKKEMRFVIFCVAALVAVTGLIFSGVL